MLPLRLTAWVVIFICNFPAKSQDLKKCGSENPGGFLSLSGQTFPQPDFSNLPDKIYRLPVVVHVFHDGEPVGVGANISADKIQEQIESLNKDFRRENNDQVRTPAVFAGIAVDTRIEFALADVDPDGLPTNGIVRINFNDFESGPYQQMSYWPAEDYINIWVIDFRTTGFAGLATFPVTDLPGLEGVPDDRLTDGLTVNTLYFGEGGHAIDASLGRTLTHEMGHFLGLLHTWGKKPHGEDACQYDDYCTDTPNSPGPSYGCSYVVACDGQTPVMKENYMDYADDVCMNLFTRDQMLRMRYVLENSPRRKSLQTSPGLKPKDEEDGYTGAQYALFPNPAVDEVRFLFNDPDSQPTRFEVYNTFGQRVHVQNLESGINQFSVINWRPGAYFLRIKDRQVVSRLVVKP